MIFMHIYALFAQNRRCPLTGWRKHAHPFHPESGYPKSALKISSRASRAARSRHVGYIFFFSFFFFFFFSTPVHSFPRCRLSRGPECFQPPLFHVAYTYIQTDIQRHTHMHTQRPRSVSLSLFFFSSEVSQKRDQTDDGDKKRKIPPMGLDRLERGNYSLVSLAVARARVQVRFVLYIDIYIYICICICICIYISGHGATRTWPKAGISLISFPAALPTEVAIKIVWKGGRYAYNEYSRGFTIPVERPGIRSWKGACRRGGLYTRRGGRPRGRSSAVFWNYCQGEGNVMRRERKRGN